MMFEITSIEKLSPQIGPGSLTFSRQGPHLTLKKQVGWGTRLDLPQIQIQIHQRVLTFWVRPWERLDLQEDVESVQRRLASTD